MQTYQERCTEIVLSASVAVMVLLNRDNTDMEFWPVVPRLLPESELTAPAEFAARKLRTVGLVGICGGLGRVAFKEALPAEVVAALGTAFSEYVRARATPAVVEPEEQKTDAAEWLKRLWSLPDTRPN